jgi:hypothetical protein
MRLTTLLSTLAVVAGLAVGLVLPTLNADASESGVSRGTTCSTVVQSSSTADSDGPFVGGINPYGTSFNNPGVNPYGVSTVTSGNCPSPTATRPLSRPNTGGMSRTRD